MGFWNSISGWFGNITDSFETSGNAFDTCRGHDINPCTGLPMIGDGCGGVDVGGSPYGMDVHQDDNWATSSSAWDDSFSGGIGSSWDD